MASSARRLPGNTDGDWFVDDSCIDCGACRWIAAASFSASGGLSVVSQQPRNDAEETDALAALAACPTGSIGADGDHGLRRAAGLFPRQVTDGVYHLGFHSEDSYGAASWLVVRPEGNVMIDSPRFNEGLARRIEALGTVRWLVLTHRDDVADHDRWRARLGCDRVLHRGDPVLEPERWVEDDVELQPGVRVLCTPGHTRGSICVLIDEVLFTGDSLAFHRRLGHLYAFRGATWFSWSVLTKSLARLQQERFTWVLPGHGAPVHLPADEMQASLQRCLDWM